MFRSDLAALRVRKDVNELNKAKYTCSHARTRVDFPDGVDNMLRLIFFISIAENAGTYANGDFTFFVEIPKTYPFHPPTVTCLTRTWHPNIDASTGRVMMAILGKEWRPVLSINAVLLGLQLIFLEPTIDYVLNPTAAEQLHQDPVQFRNQVQQILYGGRYYGFDFPEHSRQVEKQQQQMRLRLKRSHGQFDESPLYQESPLCEDDCSMVVEPQTVPIERSPFLWKRKRLN
ncbi:hypothetical protein Poli38472_008333 [Pythium oligandrum]|uniref:UBC core domain-containing protein n=1 Tax=Pythium oligandrum TaxID=41045 RepID=A0A8K1CL85_PYTOL|nr:hypothetical protein Poli38472_008333 [Pythium oligandrum]|eukprot:TMW65691.1 hypothetical protein Poli38472_008333 [Pythium oligandrum]